MEESDEVPLLIRDVVEEELFSGNLNVLHQVWACDQNEDQKVILKRKPTFQGLVVPELNCSESLSQIFSQVSEPSEERKTLSRVEAHNLLKEVTTAAYAAQKALEHIYGENFNDATREELEAREAPETGSEKFTEAAKGQGCHWFEVMKSNTI